MYSLIQLFYCKRGFFNKLQTKLQTNFHFYVLMFFFHNINVKENGFFSERELKKALRDTLTRAAWLGPSNV